jgi:hypothetical protein
MIQGLELIELRHYCAILPPQQTRALFIINKFVLLVPSIHLQGELGTAKEYALKMDSVAIMF